MPSGMHRDNAVDVLFDDGMMRYGRVVDVAVNGLFVDLLCPDRRREFVPFDRLFVLSKASEAELSPSNSTEFSTVPVEVLVEETRLGPWIWIRGAAVRFGRGMEHGIEAKWRRPYSGEACTDFVPSERIRWTVQTERNGRRLAICQRNAGIDGADCSPDEFVPLRDHVYPGAFVKQALQLDEEFRSLSSAESEALVMRLNGYEADSLGCTVAVVDFADGRLGYICQPRNPRHDDSGNRRALAAVAGRYMKYVRTADEIPPINDKMAIPTELCLEVFSHLHTVAQMRLRTVCAAWNAMLEEPVVSGRITLGAYFYPGDKWRFSHFLSLATLYKRLQAGTQHVTMAHFGSLDIPERNAAIDYLTIMCEMIHCLAQQRTGVRLRSLHMETFNFELATHSALESAGVSECVLHQADRSTVRPAVDWDLESLQDFIAVCSRLPCHTLLMTNCDVHLSCAFFFRGWRYTFAVSVGIAAARLPIDADFGCALWDALDAWLPVPDEEKVVELLELVKGNPGGELKLKQLVCKVLCTLHAADPRPSAYRGKQWCVEGLQGLQLEKLSRIARLFLVQIQRMTAKPGLEGMHARLTVFLRFCCRSHCAPFSWDTLLLLIVCYS